MPQFNSYERSPGQFSDGFDEGYSAQIEQPAVNGNGDGHAEDAITVMADALAWVLQYCWDRRGGPAHPRTALHRFVAISMTMRPDLVDMTFQQMARKLRISKATLSWHSVSFSDKAGLHFRPNRRESARRKFSEAQKAAWIRRRQALR